MFKTLKNCKPSLKHISSIFFKVFGSLAWDSPIPRPRPFFRRRHDHHRKFRVVFRGIKDSDGDVEYVVRQCWLLNKHSQIHQVDSTSSDWLAISYSYIPVSRSAPLILSTDLDTLYDWEINILQNKHVIAINQDALGKIIASKKK